MARAKDIEGLTPEQIQSKFALENTPDHMIDIDVPSGTEVEAGVVNENFYQTGGGTQFRLMEQIPDASFQNLQILPGAKIPEGELLKNISGENNGDLMDDELFDPFL
jgi:hypothetical protein